MRIKKREVLFSVIIVLVMIFIGIFVSDAILQGAVSKSESYRTATVIENTDQFYYGMDTNFGNVLVYGDVSSNSSVTYDEIGGGFIYCCFARIADPIKAQAILEKHKDRIEVYTSEEVLENIKNDRWGRWLEADWAGIDVTPKEDYIKEHAGDQFVVAEDRQDIDEDEDGYPDYDVDYSYFNTAAIDDITEENGFAEIDCQWGAGRDG